MNDDPLLGITAAEDRFLPQDFKMVAVIMILVTMVTMVMVMTVMMILSKSPLCREDQYPPPKSFLLPSDPLPSPPIHSQVNVSSHTFLHVHCTMYNVHKQRLV